MKQRIALAAFLIINLLFAYKYFLRFSEYSFVVSLVYLASVLGLFLFLRNSNIKLLSNSFFYFGIVAFYAICFMLVYTQVDPFTLKPDRWSVITNFWAAAFQGDYPYAAKSHMGNYPGPMPIYFVLALPFVWLNEIGYFSIFGLIILTFFYRRKMKPKESLILMILLVSSIAIFWEMYVRSTILVNAALFLLFIHWFINIESKGSKNFWLSAVIGGLLLSTRSVFILPLITVLVYFLKTKEYTFKQLVLWGGMLSMAFAATFVPFLILYPTSFFEINPFIVQGEYILPTQFGFIFIGFAAIAGMGCKKKSDLLFASGLVYLLFFFVYAGFNGIRYGFVYSYLESKTDISYALFSVPFLLYSIFIEKAGNKRELGQNS